MDITLSGAVAQFGAGTSVDIYQKNGSVPNGRPPGNPLTTAVVASNGTLVVTGLTPEREYLGYANVGGNHRYFSFFVPGISRPAPGHAFADETTVLPDRGLAALLGAGVTATDDPTNDRTVITIPGGASGSVNIKDYGAVGDGVTDDAAAIQAALDSPSNASPWAGSTVLIPPGKYYCSTTLLIRRVGTILSGAARSGGLGQGQAGVTQLLFPDGMTGIKTVYPVVGGTARGDWSLIENLDVVAQNRSIAGAHGFQMDFKAWIRNCTFTNFSGDGIHINAAVPNSNSNNWRIDWCRCSTNSKNGLAVNGNDANAGMAVGLDCSTNGEWGIIDTSFLGNTYVACHTADNGSAGAYVGYAGGPFGGYKATGAVNATMFLNCYAESGQGVPVTTPQIDTPSIAFGGTNMNFSSGTGTVVSASAPGLNIDQVVTKTDANHGGFTIGGGYPWRMSGGGDTFYMQYEAASKAFAPWFNNAPARPFTLTGTGHPVGGGQILFEQGIYMPGLAKIDFGPAAPTTGTHSRGDIVFNAAPSAGGKVGFVCTATGTPGTWKAFGVIDP